MTLTHSLLLSFLRTARLVEWLKSCELFFFKSSDGCLRNIKGLSTLGSEKNNSVGIVMELKVPGGTQVRCYFLTLVCGKTLQG